MPRESAPPGNVIRSNNTENEDSKKFPHDNCATLQYTAKFSAEVFYRTGDSETSAKLKRRSMHTSNIYYLTR